MTGVAALAAAAGLPTEAALAAARAAPDDPRLAGLEFEEMLALLKKTYAEIYAEEIVDGSAADALCQHIAAAATDALEFASQLEGGRC